MGILLEYNGMSWTIIEYHVWLCILYIYTLCICIYIYIYIYISMGKVR